MKFATVSRNKAGQYHVSITVEREIPKLSETNKELDIDLGIKTLATCSNGTVYENIKAYRTLRCRMKVLQSRQTKKKKGSKNWERARRMLANKHQKIKNTRQDHLHKTTTKIVNESQVIYLETLNVQNIMKNNCVAGAVAAATFYETMRQIEYKSA